MVKHTNAFLNLYSRFNLISYLKINEDEGTIYAHLNKVILKTLHQSLDLVVRE